MIKRCVLLPLKRKVLNIIHTLQQADVCLKCKRPLKKRVIIAKLSLLHFHDFFFFVFAISSTFCNIFICFFWISSVYPLKSSSVISPAFSSFLRSSFPSRRTLRTATLASSAYFSQLLQDHDDVLLLMQEMQYELQFHH